MDLMHHKWKNNNWTALSQHRTAKISSPIIQNWSELAVTFDPVSYLALDFYRHFQILFTTVCRNANDMNEVMQNCAAVFAP